MNSEPMIRRIMERPPAWLPLRSKQGDIIISCRIRLARNLQYFPFPLNASASVRGEIANTFFSAMETLKDGEKWQRLALATIHENTIRLLFERKLISREFLTREPGRFLALSPDPRLSVMINEEDHLRMQYCRAGEHLRESWKKLSAFDTELQKVLPFAFIPGQGYATSCPTNLGTGIRASLMMHLPALRLLDRLGTLSNGLSALGLTARGLDGEGSKFAGNLFQISNQSTLGESEDAIIDRLCAATYDIEQAEREAREELQTGPGRIRLLDCCSRAYANLRHAYLISTEETLNLLSYLRLGVDLGLFSKIRLFDINRMILLLQPAHLCFQAGKILDPMERAEYRASMLRNILGSGTATDSKQS
ncbi:MAG: ATP--guanido phosphotransferase [Lentisphaeria bacterium]|nr:ATP--guanido phosphotransferase [Lentisphaeria bacterium]